MPSEYVLNRSPPRVGQVDPLQRRVDLAVGAGRGSGPAPAGCRGRTGTGRSPAPRSARRSGQRRRVARRPAEHGGRPAVGRTRPSSIRSVVVLPGAVRAEEAVDLAAADGQVDRVDRGRGRRSVLVSRCVLTIVASMASIVRRRASPVVASLDGSARTQIRVRSAAAPRGRAARLGVLWSARGDGPDRLAPLVDPDPAVPLLVVCLGGTRPAGANQDNRPTRSGTCWSRSRRSACCSRRRAPLAGVTIAAVATGVYFGTGEPYGPILFVGPICGLVPGRELPLRRAVPWLVALPGRPASPGRRRGDVRGTAGPALLVWAAAMVAGRRRRGRGRLRAGRPAPGPSRPRRARSPGARSARSGWRWPRSCTTASGTAWR